MSYKSIVLSGNPGAGKSALAEALSKEYHLSIFSIGRIWREKYEETHPLKDSTFIDYWKATSMADNRNVNEMAKLVFEHGSVIGELRYTYNLDKSVCLLVFVTADLEIRAARSTGRAEHKGMSIPEIAKALKAREDEEVIRAHELYGKDYDYRDPKNYHLVLDSGKLSIAQEVDKINALMRE
jgi:cytidylate kinase